MAEVESTHSNGKHSLEDADAPVKAKLLKTENGTKPNGNGVVKGAEESAAPAANADAEKSEADAGTAEESNDVLAQTQSDVSKHNEESNTNDTNGDGVTSGRAARKVKAGQENSTSAYGDEEEDDGEDVDDEGDEGEDSDEDDEDDDGDDGHEGDEDDGEDDDEDGEGPEGDDDDDDDDEEDGDE